MGLLANRSTRELHDLDNTNANCQIPEIQDGRTFATLAAGLDAGFDPCDYCLPDVLAAHIRQGPSPVGRTETLHLDGSRSKPRRGAKKVTQWHWSVTPMDQVGHAITCEEPQLSLVLLGEVKVELTVRNDAGEHHMRPRKIKPVRRRWQRIAWSTPASGGGLHQLIIDGFLAFGRNICSMEAGSQDQTSGHVVHTDAPADWRSFYTRDAVPDGATEPWAGCWYVTGHTLFIARDELVSDDLFPGSALWTANEAAGRGADVRALRSAVAAHEHLHSSIIYERRRSGALTTVKALEELVRTDEDALVSDANSTVGAFETKLQQPSEDEVHQRMAAGWGGRSVTVMIHDGAGGFVSRTLADLAAIGD